MAWFNDWLIMWHITNFQFKSADFLFEYKLIYLSWKLFATILLFLFERRRIMPLGISIWEITYLCMVRKDKVVLYFLFQGSLLCYVSATSKLRFKFYSRHFILFNLKFLHSIILVKGRKFLQFIKKIVLIEKFSSVIAPRIKKAFREMMLFLFCSFCLLAWCLHGVTSRMQGSRTERWWWW